MLRLSANHTQLTGSGSWTLTELPRLRTELQGLSNQLQKLAIVDLSHVTAMDTAGALLLCELLAAGEAGDPKRPPIQLSGLNHQFEHLYSLISGASDAVQASPPSPPEKKTPFYYLALLGAWALNRGRHFLAACAFIGELWVIIIHNILHPRRIQWHSILKIIDAMGYQALPIVSLMSFLIGIVLAYQLASELSLYGATLFIVDISGIAVLREFSPLITAIIVAGRTSTAFAAFIGTMKVNEEMDALATMGVRPMERLVLPRVVGLIVALPLLTVCSNFFGMLGSMIMTKAMVDLSYAHFLGRFRDAVDAKELLLGMVKTPVFAVIIALVGCLQGFQTKMSADSVGQQTTKAAVRAIFLIIVTDAAFSILFNVMDL